MPHNLWLGLAVRFFQSGRYSPECLEGVFSEVRFEGSLRFALRKDLLQLYLISRESFALLQGRFLLSF
jgi:hypothetical protein